MSASPTSDDTGAAVPLPASVSRVVSLVPSLTEAVAVTAPGLLVGATDWCSHPADLDVVRVRGTKNPDVDAVVALRPDLVLANAEENREQDLDALRAAGLAVWVTAPTDVPEALVSLRRALAACGLAAPAWLRVAELVWAQPWTLPRRTAVVPVWRRPWMALGRDTFAGDVLARLGVDNALAGSPDRYPRFPPPVDGVDLVVLPDEPYAFTPDDGPEAFPGVEARCVSGRALTWYGPSLAEARAVLAAQLHDRAGTVAGALLGPVRPGPVPLAEPDPSWPTRFEQHRERITAAVGDLPVEHVGSTSVPGLVAKPVVDVQVEAPDLDAAAVALVDAGYALRAVEPGHRLVRTDDSNVHLHLPGDPALAERRRLRDRLRTDDDARARYGALKRSLAAQDWTDVDAYAEAKGPLIRELLS